ncbi:MAG: hypothetical protein WC889_20385, partial [Myxococcota bacterium]
MTRYLKLARLLFTASALVLTASTGCLDGTPATDQNVDKNSGKGAFKTITRAATVDENLSWEARYPFKGSSLVASLPDRILFFCMEDQKETWEWDGQKYTLKLPLHHPNVTYGAAMAAVGSKVILFGGKN